MADTLDCRSASTASQSPRRTLSGARRLIEEVASKKIAGEEDRYSRTDLWDFQANVDGAQEESSHSSIR